MKTDSLFYRIFARWPELLFRLIALPQSSVGYRFTSEEIKQTACRIDGLFSPPKHKHDAPLIFLEVQIQKDKHLYARLFNEIFMYLRQYEPEQPWRAVVIYPSKTQESQHCIQHYKTLLDSSHVDIIYLKDLLKKLPDAPGMGFLRLIMATKTQAKPQAVNMVNHADTGSKNYGISKQDYLEWIETILVYKFSDMTWEEIRTMLDIENIDLKDTRVYQDAFHQGAEKERNASRLREIALVKRFLERRIGTLPKTVMAKLDKLSLAQTEALTDAVFDLNTVQELQNWLKTHCQHNEA